MEVIKTFAYLCTNKNKEIMIATVTRNFKTAKGIRVVKGEQVWVLPVIGLNEKLDVVEIVGENFKMRTLQSLANKLTQAI